jgi:hypothetical protein
MKMNLMQKTTTCIDIAADQNPNKPIRSFWTLFLSQPTSFY